MSNLRTTTSLLPLGLIAAAAAVAQLPSAVAEQEPAAPRLPVATRGPVRILFNAAGTQAYVAESDTGSVAVVDVASGRVLRRLATGGKQPGGLALLPNGALLVANAYSGSVAALDAATGKRIGLLLLRGEPADVAVAPHGRRAYVSLAQLDEVAVLELPQLRVSKRIPAGRRPRSLALSADGRTLLAANFQGGDVSLIDTASLRETRRAALTGVNLRGIALSPSGERAFVTGQIPGNTRATREPLEIWKNAVFTLDLRRPLSPAATGSEGRLDFATGASPDPDGIVALGEDLVAVALGGSDQTLLVKTPASTGRTFDPVILQRSAVGARPRGVAATPDGREVWVANELDSTISVLDAADLRPSRKIELGFPTRRDLRLEGRYLFSNASLAKGRRFTCASCHPFGNTDGLTWEFAHVPDGLKHRNTRNLRGGITLTAPFRWSGHEDDIEVFFQSEITGLLQGPKQVHDPLHALWNLVDQFPMPPNPYREEGDRLSSAARRGQMLFTGKARCGHCHAGEFSGGTGMKSFVGTTHDGRPLDVPHLHGSYDSAPYLHDGRAATLEAVFARHNVARKHGKAHVLTKRELADLLRYVREL